MSKKESNRSLRVHRKKDMSDMSEAIKEMNSKTLPSLDKLKKRHEMLQAKLLEGEEK